MFVKFQMRTNLLITLLSLLFGFKNVFPQYDSIRQNKSNISLSLNFQKGFIIPHSATIRSVSYSKPWVIESDFSWHYSSDKAWQYCSCYPRIGISAMYINFDNPSILGRGYTLAPYVEPFLSAYKKFSVSIRFSTGVAYLDKIYHPIDNPENLFFSARISYLLSLNLAFNYRLTQRFNLRLSGNYNHISNGGNKEPNKGINFPTLALGIDKYFKPVSFLPRDKAVNKIPEKRTSFKLGLLGTAKKPLQEKNDRYLIYGVYFSWNYFMSRKSTITTGLEYVNDGSLQNFLRKTEISPPDHKKVGMLAGHELYLGKFRFSQQLGVYLYSPAKTRDPIYQRWGLDFLVVKRLYVGINLKAHRHVADFMDARIGCEL
jgi:hypothetical protein